MSVIAFLGYNKLRILRESVNEASSSIGVVARKKTSLINQFQYAVKGYQESEKFVMLKISGDLTNPANITHMHQQAGRVPSSVNSFAEKYPELKSDQLYRQLMHSMQA